MIVVLATLIVAFLLASAARAFPRYGRWSGLIALVGVGLGLLIHLVTEVLRRDPGYGLIEWPPALARLGEPVYASDALSAGLGTWCLLLGFIYVWLAISEPGRG